MEKFDIVPVGYVRSDLTHRGQAPRQGRDDGISARIDILPAYTRGLEGISQWSQLLVICWMHLADRETLTVRPKGDPGAPLAGVFGTRSPARPNPAVVYTVDLLAAQGSILYIRGIDAVDGTPVLDIKPHIHRLDE